MSALQADGRVQFLLHKKDGPRHAHSSKRAHTNAYARQEGTPEMIKGTPQVQAPVKKFLHVSFMLAVTKKCDIEIMHTRSHKKVTHGTRPYIVCTHTISNFHPRLRLLDDAYGARTLACACVRM